MAIRLDADHIASAARGFLNDNGGRYNFEPQRQNNWTLDFTLPRAITTVRLQGGNARNLGEAALNEMLSLSLLQMPFPQEESSVQEFHFGNEVRKIAGKTTYSNEPLTCYDYVDDEVAGVLKAWRSLVQNPENGKMGYASDYKAVGDIIFFDTKGLRARRWRLWGIWPRSIKYGEGNMASTEGNKIEVEFVMDKYMRIVSDNLRNNPVVGTA